MSHLDELEYALVEEHIFPCDADDGQYLRLRWDHEEPKNRYLWIETGLSLENAPLWMRLIAALKILFRKHVTSAEMLVTDAVAFDLVRTLNKAGVESVKIVPKRVPPPILKPKTAHWHRRNGGPGHEDHLGRTVDDFGDIIYDPEFEALLAEEEAIERSVREHHETWTRPADTAVAPLRPATQDELVPYRDSTYESAPIAAHPTATVPYLREQNDPEHIEVYHNNEWIQLWMEGGYPKKALPWRRHVICEGLSNDTFETSVWRR